MGAVRVYWQRLLQRKAAGFSQRFESKPVLLPGTSPLRRAGGSLDHGSSPPSLSHNRFWNARRAPLHQGRSSAVARPSEAPFPTAFALGSGPALKRPPPGATSKNATPRGPVKCHKTIRLDQYGRIARGIRAALRDGPRAPGPLKPCLGAEVNTHPRRLSTRVLRPRDKQRSRRLWSGRSPPQLLSASPG